MKGGPIDVFGNLWTEKEVRELHRPHPDMNYIVNVLGAHIEKRQYHGHELDECIKMMDEAGMDKVVVPAWQFRGFLQKDYLIDRSWQTVAKMVERYPDRLIGAYGINPYKRMDGVFELEKAVKEYGFKAAQMFPNAYERAINHADWYPYYAKCVELDIPLMTYCGQIMELQPSKYSLPLQIEDVALYFNRLRIVGTNLGWPWDKEMMAITQKHPNVYIATAGHPARRWSSDLINFINTWGKGKVMWATTFPWVVWKEGLSEIDKLNLRPDAKALLIKDAALKVFKL